MKISAKEQRSRDILEAATEILTLKPTATLQEIADYTKVGIATLHRYFPTREMLLDALALNAIDLVDLALKKIVFDYNDLDGTLLQIFDALIPLGNKISFLSSAASVDENPIVVSGEKRLKETIVFALDRWKEKGLLNGSISSRWMINVMYQLLFVTWQEIQAGELARKDTPSLLLKTILQGFAAK